jgi:hypothetical protein
VAVIVDLVDAALAPDAEGEHALRLGGQRRVPPTPLPSLDSRARRRILDRTRRVFAPRIPAARSSEI